MREALSKIVITRIQIYCTWSIQRNINFDISTVCRLAHLNIVHCIVRYCENKWTMLTRSEVFVCCRALKICNKEDLMLLLPVIVISQFWSKLTRSTLRLGISINHWKIQPSDTCNCSFICFVVQRIIMLYNSCFAVCNFLFAQLAEGIHSTVRILLCKPEAK